MELGFEPPNFFFTLLRLWFPSVGRRLSIQQIHEGLRNLEKDGYLSFVKEMKIQGRYVHLYYPTDLGFEQSDFWVQRMKVDDPRGLLSDPRYS